MMFGRNKGSQRVLKALPHDGVGVEIGVWRGDSSEQFLCRAKHLHVVDPWSVCAYENSDEFGGYRDYLDRYSKLVGTSDESAFQKYYDTVYDSVVKRFKDKPVTIHRCTSAEFFSDFDGRVDWIYIDGSHSFDGCLADLNSAAKITDMIFGDDYGVKDGVTGAVDAFAMSRGISVSMLGDSQYGMIV